MSMIVAVGTQAGRDTINRTVFNLGIGSLWLDFSDRAGGGLTEQGVPKAALEELKSLNQESFHSEEALVTAIQQQVSGSVYKEHGALLLGQRRGPIPWERYFGGFDTLFAGSAPIFWTFFLLTGLSIFVLRSKDADVERPFRIPGYPITPLIFCGMCLFGLYRAAIYAKLVVLIGLVPLVIGVPLYVISRYQPTSESEPLRRQAGDSAEANGAASTGIQEAPSSAFKEKQP
jgi:hypothetical protein